MSSGETRGSGSASSAADQEPGSTGRFVGTVLVTAVAAGAVYLGATYEEPKHAPDIPDYSSPLPRSTPTARIDVRPQPSQDGRPVTYSQACLDALNRPGVTLDEEGCRILEAYAADGSETGDSQFSFPWMPSGCGGRIVGYIDTTGSELKYLTGGMPTRFQEAIQWAASGDPIIQRLAKHAEGGIIFTLSESRNAAAYFTRAEAYDEKDMVQFCLRLGEDGSYPTFSALRSTMRHELGHTFYDQLQELAATNPEVATILAEYEQAFIDELRVVAESTRQSMQGRAVEVLTGVYESYDPTSEEAQIVKYVLDCFGRKGGLDDLIAQVSAEGEHNLVNLHALFTDESSDMFALAAKTLGYRYSYGYDLTGRPVNEIALMEGSGLLELSQDFQKQIEAAFGYIDEGTVIPYFDVGGHPQQSATEWTASVFASLREDPRAVEHDIRQLPTAQRGLAIRKLELLERLIAATEPGMEQDLHLPEVIARLKNSGAYTVARLAVGDPLETIATYRDGRWMVSAEWARERATVSAAP